MRAVLIKIALNALGIANSHLEKIQINEQSVVVLPALILEPTTHVSTDVCTAMQTTTKT